MNTLQRTTAALILALITVIATLLALLAPSARAQEDLTISTNDGLALTLSPDGLVTGLTVDGAELVSSPAPAVWIRDMSAAGDVTEPNLVSNPGFEDGETGWTSYFNSGRVPSSARTHPLWHSTTRRAFTARSTPWASFPSRSGIAANRVPLWTSHWTLPKRC